MFRNLKKKIAKITLTVLALQLAFMGLGTGATGAYAVTGTDVTPPTANVVHSLAAKTIVYTFSEPVQLLNNDMTPATLTPDKLAIFKVVGGNYDLTTKTPNAIESAVMGAGETSITMTYAGSLVRTSNTDYVVDAWGYKIVDMAGNQMLPDLLQVFTVNGDNIAPTGDVVHDMATGTIVYTFSEPVQLLNNDMTPAILTPDKLAIFKVVGGNYDLTTKTSNAIESAVMGAGETSITMTYAGSLVRTSNTDYVVDAWGYKIVDMAGNQMLPSLSQIFTVTGDSIAPVITAVVSPTITNTKGQIVATFTANEVVTIDNLTYGVDGSAFLPTLLPVMNPVGLDTEHTLTFPADFFKGAANEIVISYVGTDAASNSTVAQIINVQVDTTTPAAVTGITTFVDAVGHVTISWTNPTAGTYTKLRIVRVGDFSAVLGLDATSFTDLTTVQGITYQYVIVVGDDAGNEVSTPQIAVSVPAAVVAAAVSDTTSYYSYDVAEDTDTSAGTEEVKADTTDNETTDTDEDNDFPTWGILLLLILAAVGGYLIWSGKPEEAPVVGKTKTGTTKKK